MYTTRICSLVSFKEMTSCPGRRSTTLFSSGLTYSTIRHAILFFICSSRHQQIAISPVASSFRVRSITYQFRLSFPILRRPTRTVSHILLPIHTTLSTCWLVYTDSVTNDLITFLEPRSQGLNSRPTVPRQHSLHSEPSSTVRSPSTVLASSYTTPLLVLQRKARLCGNLD